MCIRDRGSDAFLSNCAITKVIRTAQMCIRDSIYTEHEAKQRAEQELQLFFEKIKIKGLQIIENGVKIEVNGQVCTAKGSLLVEEEAVRTQKLSLIHI